MLILNRTVTFESGSISIKSGPVSAVIDLDKDATEGYTITINFPDYVDQLEVADLHVACRYFCLLCQPYMDTLSYDKLTKEFKQHILAGRSEVQAGFEDQAARRDADDQYCD